MVLWNTVTSVPNSVTNTNVNTGDGSDKTMDKSPVLPPHELHQPPYWPGYYAALPGAPTVGMATFSCSSFVSSAYTRVTALSPYSYILSWWICSTATTSPTATYAASAPQPPRPAAPAALGGPGQALPAFDVMAYGTPVPVASLPSVKIVPPAVKQAILSGKVINLSVLLLALC